MTVGGYGRNNVHPIQQLAAHQIPQRICVFRQYKVGCGGKCFAGKDFLFVHAPNLSA
jgi:hypothetical protein